MSNWCLVCFLIRFRCFLELNPVLSIGAKPFSVPPLRTKNIRPEKWQQQQKQTKKHERKWKNQCQQRLFCADLCVMLNLRSSHLAKPGTQINTVKAKSRFDDYWRTLTSLQLLSNQCRWDALVWVPQPLMCNPLQPPRQLKCPWTSTCYSNQSQPSPRLGECSSPNTPLFSIFKMK